MTNAVAVRKLDPTKRSSLLESFEKELGSRVIGQTEAVNSVVEMFQIYKAGMSKPGHTISNLLFLGPTGTGKTRTVEAMAEVCFADPRCLLKVDCAEFQHSHEIAKLIGSPPGYLGHRETHPIITQAVLDQHHTEQDKVSFLLFDEIEKASDALWQLLLGIMDKATLTLGDNSRVDFQKTMVFLTSNLGATDIQNLMTGGLGFGGSALNAESRAAKIDGTAVGAARKKFPAEFMNRIDKSIVFKPLERPSLERILDIELNAVAMRCLAPLEGAFSFQMTSKSKQFLLDKGTDQKSGARHLNRMLERYLVHPLSRMITSKEINPHDKVLVDVEGEELCFYLAAPSLA